MTKPYSDWTVLPHGPLTIVDENILTVTGTLKMPLADFERRMTVVRLADGQLVVYSAIALDEAEMSVLATYGRVAFLIVPSDRHRLDVLPWKKRFPLMKVIAPSGARAKVEQLVPVDATTIDFHDPSIQFVIAGGTNQHEAALIVRGPRGTTLIVNEIIFNAADQPGFAGWMFHTLGMTGDAPHIPPVVKMTDVADSAALAAQLEAWSHISNLTRIIVSHGDMIEDDAPGVLHQIARDMDSIKPTAGRATR